jgi:copper oxidase (laccase) domain-containing protein
MQLIGLLIFIGILVLLLILAIYLARGEKSKNKAYGSWSNVLGPQFRGSAFDVGEDLKKEMEEGGRTSRRKKRKHH